MSAALVSIIVPVYNTEAYLPACVDSVLSQSCGSWELLLVDDGSPDGAGALCDAYAAKDARIRVFHRTNGGVSRARNTGLAEAAGDFIVFLDSDDLWEKDFLARLLEKREKSGARLCGCGFGELKGDRVSADLPPLPREVLPAEDFLFEALTGAYKLPLSCCNWLFPAEALKDKRFDEGRPYGEDTLLLCRVLAEGGTVCYLPEPLYLYRTDREGNTLSRRDLDKCRRTVDAWQRILELFPDENSKVRHILKKILTDAAMAACREAKREKKPAEAGTFRRLARRSWKSILPCRELRSKDKLRLGIYIAFPLLSEKLMLKLKGRV